MSMRGDEIFFVKLSLMTRLIRASGSGHKAIKEGRQPGICAVLLGVLVNDYLPVVSTASNEWHQKAGYWNLATK